MTAMYQRNDGIVEFDPDVCIGCKACLQACPYDAIYIDPDSGTAAKCHYCSHRTDLGLEPACVVVCPEHAIIAGDLDDPQSEISQVVAKESLSVRKPEQGTAPKVFYIEGHEVALRPTATAKPDTFMWADVLGDAQPQPGASAPDAGGTAASGAPIRTPGPQSAPGPIRFAPGRVAEHMVQVGYNAQHQRPWHWPVPAYLVTKGLGAGILMVFAALLALGQAPASPALVLGTGGIALLFTAITTVLLIADLERPERFLRILLRPQWKSWLTRGAFILVGYTLVVSAWFAAELLGFSQARGPLLALGAPLAVGVAVYTAFLFGQAEGRDLWQSTLFPFHLVLQAGFLGAGALAVLGHFSGHPLPLASNLFVAGLFLDLFVTLLGELGMPHASEAAAAAARSLTHGAYRNHFWWGSIALGHAVPIALLLLVPSWAALCAAVLAATAGLYLYEYAFVMAPQDISNS